MHQHNILPKKLKREKKRLVDRANID